MKCAICGTKKDVELVDISHRKMELTDKQGSVWRVVKRPECEDCREKKS